MLKGIYLIVAERSDEPCSAELLAFTTKENAQREMDRLIKKVINVLNLTKKQEDDARKSYEESKKESFVVIEDEDDSIEIYYRIEYVPLEDV